MLHPLWQNAIWRTSSGGIEIRISVQREGGATLKIKRPWMSETRVEIAPENVAATVEEFQAIDESPERFKTFVNACGEKNEARASSHRPRSDTNNL